MLRKISLEIFWSNFMKEIIFLANTLSNIEVKELELEVIVMEGDSVIVID